MHSLISAAVIVICVMIVECHPICNGVTSQPTCYTNITVNRTFLNEWLSLHDESDGLDQLRRRRDSSLASVLFKLTKEDGGSHNCYATYRSMVVAPQSVDPSIDVIRDYFNAYLMHKVYVEHLVELGVRGLLSRKWLTSLDVYNNLSQLSSVLGQNVKNIAQLLNNTCTGCTRNCTMLADKSALLISRMEKCNSPLHSIVNVIAEHSENLYETVDNLSDQEPADVSNEMVDIPSSDIDNFCYCSVGTDAV